MLCGLNDKTLINFTAPCLGAASREKMGFDFLQKSQKLTDPEGLRKANKVKY
jgi:hypothetical protein